MKKNTMFKYIIVDHQTIFCELHDEVNDIDLILASCQYVTRNIDNSLFLNIIITKSDVDFLLLGKENGKIIIYPPTFTNGLKKYDCHGLQERSVGYLIGAKKVLQDVDKILNFENLELKEELPVANNSRVSEKITSISTLHSLFSGTKENIYSLYNHQVKIPVFKDGVKIDFEFDLDSYINSRGTDEANYELEFISQEQVNTKTKVKK